MPTAIITGANRGLGLEFVRQLMDSNWTVYAICRTPSKELLALQPAQVFVGDVRSQSDIQTVFESIQGPIDVLINNAGIADGRWPTLEDVDWDVALDVLHVNAVAPMMVTQTALPLLRKADNPCVAMVTSLMGSIADCHSGRSYAYRASKTALNMFTAAARNELQNSGIRSVLLHPGWVKTDMGGQNAPVDVMTSVAGMLEQIHSTSIEHSGRFVEYTGAILPW